MLRLTGGEFNAMLKRFFFIVLLIGLLCSSSVFAAPITSGFGWRIHPVTGEWKFHAGIDIGYDEGTPIVAMKDGRIVYAAEYGGYGNCVIIEHYDGDHTLYGHCSGFASVYGQEVERGDVIAYVGSTGISTGPHLHLEWWHNGEYVDPIGLW